MFLLLWDHFRGGTSGVEAWVEDCLMELLEPEGGRAGGNYSLWLTSESRSRKLPLVLPGGRARRREWPI